MKGTLAVLALVASGAAAAAEPAADRVLECMRANIPQTLQVKQLELTATDRTGGSRTLKGRLYGTNEDGRLRAMMRIEGPADLAGASYLLREGRKAGSDEMYVFVPALNKVRRITGAAVDGSLWGTDLSYADVKQIQSAYDEADATLEPDATLDNAPVHVLRIRPTAAQGTRYTAIRLWVDPKSCVALKAEFLEGDSVRKRMSGKAADLKESAGRWYLADALMADLKEGTRTRVKVLGVSNDKSIPDRMFNPATFHIGS